MDEHLQLLNLNNHKEIEIDGCDVWIEDELL